MTTTRPGFATAYPIEACSTLDSHLCPGRLDRGAFTRDVHFSSTTITHPWPACSAQGTGLGE